MAEHEVRTGGCACRAVRYEAIGEPRRLSVCHCKDCQRRTGSAFGIACYFPREQVRLLGGATRTFERSSEAGRWVRLQFCETCGTTVHWQAEALPDLVGIAAGTLDDTGWVAPQLHVWATLRAALADGCPRMRKCSRRATSASRSSADRLVALPCRCGSDVQRRARAAAAVQHAAAQEDLGDALDRGIEGVVAAAVEAARARQVDPITCSIRPGRGDITSTRSASSTASSMLWVMNTTVLRVASQSSSRSIRSCSRVSASSAPNGSSISSSGGSWISARTIAARCCMPPESS